MLPKSRSRSHRKTLDVPSKVPRFNNSVHTGYPLQLSAWCIRPDRGDETQVYRTSALS